MRQPTDIPPLFASRAHTPSARLSARALAGSVPTGGVVVPELPEDLPEVLADAQRALIGDPAPTSTVPDATPAATEPDPEPTDSADDAIDYALIHQMRLAVSEAFRTRVPAGTPMRRDSHEQLVAQLVEDQVRDHAASVVDAGGARLDRAQRQRLHQAVMDALFGAGRLQPLLDLPLLENLEARGCDNVWLQFADGRLEKGPAIADSDEAMIADIQQMARTCHTGEKLFSPAHKRLRMALPDGSRLAADAWMSPRPSLTIRKHRFVDTDLDQIQALGAIDKGISQFLSAASRAGKRIIIAGPPAAGKTTLARAVLNALDAHISIATIESAYELFLDRMPQRHYRVLATEAQEGGEATVDGKTTGAFTLSDLVAGALQHNVERLVVGEVVGPEIIALLEAFNAGKGGLATIHAYSAADTIERMVTLITGARSNVTGEAAHRQVAQNIDLIVHIASIDETYLPGGRLHRFVDEIHVLQPGSETGVPVQRTPIYAPGPDGRAVPTGQKPPWLIDLERHEFDPDWLQPSSSCWDKPLTLIKPYRSTT